MSEPKVIELTEHDMGTVLLPVYAAYELKKGNSVTLSPPQPKLVHLSDLPEGTRIENREYDEHGSSVTDAYAADGGLFLYKSPYGEYINPIAIDEIRLLSGEFQVWQGGRCPWPEGVEVEVLMRAGGEPQLVTNKAHWWHHEGQGGDIIAHRCTGRLLQGAKLVP